ncbi:MAG: hypothetical protein ACLUKQ_01210, partial [Peptococcaceae bacterium]
HFLLLYLFLNKEARPISTKQNANNSVHVTIGHHPLFTGSDQPPSDNSCLVFYHTDVRVKNLFCHRE